MTDEERTQLDGLSYWNAKIHAIEGAFGGPHIRLSLVAAKQLRNISEAIAECEAVIQTFAGRIDSSNEALGEVAGLLRTIHQRLDDVVLPATISD